MILLLAAVGTYPTGTFVWDNTPHHPSVSYSHARLVRAQQGHEAARPLYRELLRTDPSDMTAATYIAASSETPVRHDASCRCENRSQILELRDILDQHNYTNAHIQTAMNIPPKLRYASCPIYVTPLAAGSSQSRTPVPQTGLETLIAMFLIGMVQPQRLLEDQFGPSFVPLLQDLGLAFLDEDGIHVIPYVHIFPLALPELHQLEEQQHQNQDYSRRRNLCLVTDLHPRILSSTTVGSQNHHAVMYIGPDSLALVQHYTIHHNSAAAGGILDTVLDVCTGSGIQALSVPCRKAICMDINPRALQFVKFNAALNGRQVCCILGDVVTEDLERVLPDPDDPRQSQSQEHENEQDQPILPDGSVDLLLANPPFIPVPPDHVEIQNRYGAFSSGGTDGELVLQGILKLAARVVKTTTTSSSGGGRIAIVSEFMNPNSFELRQRLQTWCPGMTGVLLTNQEAISAQTYATRRADSETEVEIWNKHLEQHGIHNISPGLLFLRRGEGGIQHHLVPKSEQGSIWTPSNQAAVAYTQQVLLQESL